MSGFFDKLTKAVGEITKKVEESGIVDDLKDLVSDGEGESTRSRDSSSATAASAAEGDSASSGDGSPHGWEGAVERAGLDPTKLLTPQQMDAVVGLGLDHSYPQMDDEWFGVTWTTQTGGGPYVEARFTHGYTDGSPVDIPGMWTFVTEETGGNAPIDVQGADAVIDELNTVYAKTASSLFYIVSGGLPEGSDVRQLHVAVAEAVVAALA